MSLAAGGEHYRATGEPREVNGRRVRYWNGPSVDPSDVLVDGRSFRGIDEYKELILEDKDQLARNLATKLLSYGTGASPNPLDNSEIDNIVTRISRKELWIQIVNPCDRAESSLSTQVAYAPENKFMKIRVAILFALRVSPLPSLGSTSSPKQVGVHRSRIGCRVA